MLVSYIDQIANKKDRMKAMSSKGQEGPRAPRVLQEEGKTRLFPPICLFFRDLIRRNLAEISGKSLCIR